MELEDQNPIEGGERHYVAGNNMVPIDKIDEFLSASRPVETLKTQDNEQK